MGDIPARWRTVEHTADLAIEVEAPSLEALFEAAAHGLAGVLRGAESGSGAGGGGSGTVRRRLELEAPDREALLVEWLRELLYAQVSEGLAFAGADIEELDETRLAARVRFRRATSAELARELKGVTYHALELKRWGELWFARVVFDL